MCFGGSKAKTVTAPPPTPPTTFDYNAANRGATDQAKQAATATAPANQEASFGSELAGAPAPQGGQ